MIVIDQGRCCEFSPRCVYIYCSIAPNKCFRLIKLFSVAALSHVRYCTSLVGSDCNSLVRFFVVYRYIAFTERFFLFTKSIVWINSLYSKNDRVCYCRQPFSVENKIDNAHSCIITSALLQFLFWLSLNRNAYLHQFGCLQMLEIAVLSTCVVWIISMQVLIIE